jgi:hypothetical protein
MENSMNNLKIRDLIFSDQLNDWIQIKDDQELKIVNKLFWVHFYPLYLSEALVCALLTDFEPSTHASYVKKFTYTDNHKVGRKSFSFYGVYSKKSLPPMHETKVNGMKFIVQYFEDSEPFEKCYYYKKGKKAFFKYANELQNILEEFGIKKGIYCRFSRR